MAVALQFEIASGNISSAMGTNFWTVEIVHRDGGHPNAQRHDKMTSVHFAAYNGTVEEILKVIESGG
jgi:hypothetical protein